jgi:hypothetical protein
MLLASFLGVVAGALHLIPLQGGTFDQLLSGQTAADGFSVSWRHRILIAFLSLPDPFTQAARRSFR